MRRVGLSVVELLVVIAIIALLVALLIPVAWNVRKRANLSPCMTNMRQIYVAWAGYMQDYDERPPSLPVLVKSAQTVFTCPSDPYPRGANSRIMRLTGVRGSYFYLSSTGQVLDNDPFIKDLLEADPNHGILVCVVHGKREPELLNNAWVDFRGLTLRLRRDGSIQQARQTSYCDSTGGRGRCLWDLMTDNRDHPARSRWCAASGQQVSFPCE